MVCSILNMLRGETAVLLVLVLSCFSFLDFAAKLPQNEVDALQQIVTTMGATFWKFNAETCKIEMVGLTPQAPRGSDSDVSCNCSFENNTVCHIITIMIKGYSLPGVLPPELAKLPYLQLIDFAFNLLSGTIPTEWSSTQLKSISVLANRLSGEIPKELANITSLTYLNLEVNKFSGNVPSQLGQLVNLGTLILSSNQLTGKLPPTLAQLKNLTDFRINDNNFTGPIPDFIQNWKQLTKLQMQATGLEGPIPLGISVLNMLTDLRITDINGPTQGFPILSNMIVISTLMLRNCNISGEIPVYIWKMRSLQLLDLSFNRLVGEIPNNISARSLLKFVFLTNNKLSGDIPDSMFKDGSSIDFSYNNFTWQGPEQPACQSNLNLYVNLYRSSSTGNTLREILPCMRDFNCPRYGCSLHVNCGGNDLTIKERNRKIVYEGDAEVEGGSAKYFDSGNYWGFSSTGDFMDDENYQNMRFVTNVQSNNLSELYASARLSPLSLTYFRYCMENGDYNVSLHFAEIQFTDDNTFSSLGKRFFDIYIQEKLVWKDFNIEDEAHGVQRPVIKQFNANVMHGTLEIRFYWAGKGTTRMPTRGVYGPLVSAISVNPHFKSCSSSRNRNASVYVIIGVVAFCITSLIVGILWWKRCWRSAEEKGKDFEGLRLQTVSFTLKEIKAATNNFDSANKIGEGGFGPVYKGLLSDGTLIAVKQLSSKSTQGTREFLNEICMISCSQHPNLVKLHGCCIEGDQLLLVYEYMENNSLAHALFDSGESQLVLDWPTRYKICIGVARGLAFLHEESRLKIVHRDIKATNVLLDRDLNPKISDFGLARLNEDQKTHISTRIAGTIGYMAPEYALWGYLTYKADVYSFGVVVLEILSGKSNNNYMPSNDCICLLDWACYLHHSENLDELIDSRLGFTVNKEEAERMVKIALLCTNGSPSLRPTMSEVISMLEVKMNIPDVVPEPSTYSNDLRFKAMREFRQEKQNQSFSGSQTQNSTTIRTDIGSSSTSTTDVNEINPNTAASH